MAPVASIQHLGRGEVVQPGRHPDPVEFEGTELGKAFTALDRAHGQSPSGYEMQVLCMMHHTFERPAADGMPSLGPLSQCSVVRARFASASAYT